jgi:DNA-binding CsgD family transcriptional regulator
LKSHTFDPVALVELGYEPQADSLAWMRAVAAPICRALDPTTEVAFAYCLGTCGPEHVHAVPRQGGLTDAEALRQLKTAHANNSAREEHAVAVSLTVPGVHSSREVAGKAPDTEYVRQRGYVDTAVAVIHPADRPPAVFATLSRRTYRIDASQRALWRKLAAHLGAGCRLSGRSRSADAVDVECVLTPEGRVVHATGDGCGQRQRERLRDAVKQVDRARSQRGRAQPEHALEVWRGLLAGRWSLVDHFDSDGRRFVLARRNEPDTPGPGLPLRQRQVLFYVSSGWSNKEVSYALGIGESTVAVHLRRALAAMHVSSRAAWIELSTRMALAADAVQR